LEGRKHNKLVPWWDLALAIAVLNSTHFETREQVDLRLFFYKNWVCTL